VKLRLLPHDGYRDPNGIVHRVTVLVTDREEHGRTFRYPVACRADEEPLQHLHYTDAPVTCFECLSEPSGYVKCVRHICRKSMLAEHATETAMADIKRCAEQAAASRL